MYWEHVSDEGHWQTLLTNKNQSSITFLTVSESCTYSFLMYWEETCLYSSDEHWCEGAKFTCWSCEWLSFWVNSMLIIFFVTSLLHATPGAWKLYPKVSSPALSHCPGLCPAPLMCLGTIGAQRWSPKSPPHCLPVLWGELLIRGVGKACVGWIQQSWPGPCHTLMKEWS